MRNPETYEMSTRDIMHTLLSGSVRYEKIGKILDGIPVNEFEIAIINSSKERLINMGFTEKEAMKIVSARELIKRGLVRINERECKQIRSSTDSYQFFKPFLEDLEYEEFHVLYLNRSNKIIKHETISIGGEAGTVTSVKKIYRTAIDLLASAIIIAHNHPSGNLVPSDSDKSITRRIREAGALIDVTVLDHIIVAKDKYYSFADEGIIND